MLSPEEAVTGVGGRGQTAEPKPLFALNVRQHEGEVLPHLVDRQTGQKTGETRQSDRERERDRQALRQTDLSMLKGKQNLGTVSRVSCGTHTSAGVNGSSRNTLTTPGCFLTMLTPENLKSSYANDA